MPATPDQIPAETPGWIRDMALGVATAITTWFGKEKIQRARSEARVVEALASLETAVGQQTKGIEALTHKIGLLLDRDLIARIQHGGGADGG